MTPEHLPNVDVFDTFGTDGDGWYWCLKPLGEPRGPFASEADAIADAETETKV